MYIPKNLEVKDPLIISELIAENGFGTLISADLTATHLPLIYESNDEGLGLLFGHFAKSNSHWQTAENQRVLVIFQGPHAYISPSWYVTKPAVPTWKLGQHRKPEDQKGVFAGLQKSTDLNAAGLCAYMEKRNVGTGS